MANLSYGITGSSYYDLAKQGRVFSAYGPITAPVIYSTAAGTGGPLIWNSSVSVNVVILGMSMAVGTASTVATSLGICGGTQGTNAPTSTTAIGITGNALVGGPNSQVNVYRVGTVANASTFFVPFIQVGTGAITVTDSQPCHVDLAGTFVVPPGKWVAIGAASTATTLVAQIGLIWAEIPI